MQIIVCYSYKLHFLLLFVYVYSVITKKNKKVLEIKQYTGTYLHLNKSFHLLLSPKILFLDNKQNNSAYQAKLFHQFQRQINFLQDTAISFKLAQWSVSPFLFLSSKINMKPNDLLRQTDSQFTQI